MKQAEILEFIRSLKSGEISEQKAFEILKNYPFNDIGCAKIDTQRELRNGASEVIFGLNKSDDEVLKIALAICEKRQNLLITRTNERVFKRIFKHVPEAKFNARANVISVIFSPQKPTKSYIAIISAGTSDNAVLEEASQTAIFLGNRVRKFSDIGVAGLHRLIAHLDEIKNAKVIIAIAGMEGALASVVAGLVKAPVIAVPTSVGYGASFGGVAALLAMLNSCANGVSVVNIDNGYGAAYIASVINHI